MPELPEVETVRRGLEPVMAGATFVAVEQRRANLRFPFPKRFTERLQGAKILSLARRAKYLTAEISSGEILLMHLGMSGRFTITQHSPVKSPGTGPVDAPFLPASGTNPKHDHVVFHLSNGASITYNDARRFGFMVLIPSGEVDTHKLLADIGVEPLSNAFHADHLAARAQGRATDLKAFLMDQRNVAGLGNIYVCEALHRARLAPTRIAGCLARADGSPGRRAEKLANAIQSVLREAITAGGSSLRDYRQTDGGLGYFQHAFQVYGREGEPCQRKGCRGRIKRIVQSGRSTFHCTACQK